MGKVRDLKLFVISRLTGTVHEQQNVIRRAISYGDRPEIVEFLKKTYGLTGLEDSDISHTSHPDDSMKADSNPEVITVYNLEENFLKKYNLKSGEKIWE